MACKKNATSAFIAKFMGILVRYFIKRSWNDFPTNYANLPLITDTFNWTCPQAKFDIQARCEMAAVSQPSHCFFGTRSRIL